MLSTATHATFAKPCVTPLIFTPVAVDGFHSGQKVIKPLSSANGRKLVDLHITWIEPSAPQSPDLQHKIPLTFTAFVALFQTARRNRLQLQQWRAIWRPALLRAVVKSHPRKHDCRSTVICQEPFLLEDTKRPSGAPPGLLACRVFSCQIAFALHSHIHRIVDKAQPVVHKVQVTPGLRSHAMLDTSRLQCCVC